MHGVPSASSPRTRRKAEIACSRLLSVTATSRHTASISASLERIAPGRETSSSRTPTCRSGIDTTTPSWVNRRVVASSSKRPNAYKVRADNASDCKQPRRLSLCSDGLSFSQVLQWLALVRAGRFLAIGPSLLDFRRFAGRRGLLAGLVILL